jgi:D-glycero-alpha-D-manno-heptose-7-phosphate kinase
VVTATAPVRVCDLGGWTDTWFAGRGAVCNIAVSPFVEVRIHVRGIDTAEHTVTVEAADFGDRYAFAPGRAPGRHPLLEAAIEEVGVPDGVALEIRVASGVPAGCSTGTSAAVVVALVGALDSLTPAPRTLHEVARTAHRVEVERLGLQSGVQDQLCAAFGGVSFIEIDQYPEARRTAVLLDDVLGAQLEQRLVLLHLGRAHRSSEVHERVIAGLLREGAGSRQLEELRECAAVGRDALEAGDLEGLGRAMTRNTDAQRRLHVELVPARAQTAIDVAHAHGASGWKVNGAGGEGGSLTILCGRDPEQRVGLERALQAADPSFSLVPARLSGRGLEVRAS